MTTSSLSNLSYLTFVSLALTLLMRESIFVQSGAPNKLRICSAGESMEVSDASCDKGFWIPDAIKPECVCATGTWILSKNYCDENFFLISGPSLEDNADKTEFTCFNFTTELRRVVSLSSQSKTYEHFVIQSNGRHIQQLSLDSITPNTDTPVVLIRLNANTEMYLMHKEGIQSDIWQKCLGKRSRNAYTHIIKSGESITYLKSMTKDELCSDERDPDFPYEMANNTDWLISRVGSYGWSLSDGELPINTCTCSPQRSQLSKMLTPRRTPVSQVQPMVEEDLQPEPLRNTDPDYDSYPGDSFNIYPKKKDPLVHAEHLKDNARATTFILTKLKDFVLTGVHPPPFHSPLFEYIRYGKRIMTSFCPEIPPNVVGNLVGMFRLLLGKIVEKHPEDYSLSGDSITHERVISSLDKCLQGMGSKSVKFFWGHQHPKRENCSNKHRQIESVEVEGKTSLLNGEEMPEGLRFKHGDVMLEVAWKVILGTHYACSEYFETNPEDLSLMYMKTQEFFTIPYVMFRWENPARDLTAAYRILNTLLIPTELGEQIDACVFAAFDASRFNTWLGRPSSESEFFPNNMLRKSMEKLAGRLGIKGHPKTNVMASRMLDDKVGYCVHDFNDPLGWSEVENFGFSATGC